MKLKFKFSSDVMFHITVEYPYVEEYEVLSRLEKCMDRFEFTFDNDTLLDVVGNYLSDETWAKVEDLECKVIKNNSEYKAGEITFDCEVEFKNHVSPYEITDFNYEDGFYEKFMWALSENGCYVDTYAIYKDGDEVEDFSMYVSCDLDTLRYSCEVTED